ncbi:V-type ATP synthase subunit D [Saccharicrinis fermentans]|uniref:V-type ATP synthase subunit D n=1 Tax=Saccharicrinis fermentans DSM 9555 = JCM 21142 TaxID=869213 RepID=W7Y8X2_9BACT|nr:V-type ATP synthase subunit D [Saccharicrinis fermentans]GAF04712.1 V-type ATP synthase subunit D [Saccharicrinis fermentans DSM 9555 = JCM 21142]
MAVKFQYNKTSQQQMDKQLKIREKALPTLQNKEAALRIEVKRAKKRADELGHELETKMADLDKISRLWGEFDMQAISIEDVVLESKKIAGVQTPVLKDVVFKKEPFALFSKPVWFLDGVKIVEDLAKIGIEREVFMRKMQLLDVARKKTTQKVNLYEKVQIPGYKDAIRKIKRFLEDEENLSKSAQKIVKDRQQKQQEQEVES